MSKLDVYLRSIERFGAAGAILTSGQAVTLRFPTGDRHATQVTPHDQLVFLVREVAPPAALDQIDKQRPARFEVESQGFHYVLSVKPAPGAWTVAIEPASAAAPAATPPPATPATAAATRAAAPAANAPVEMEIERGQYDGGPAAPVAVTSSGSTFLDGLTTAARGQRATDIYLASGIPPILRAGGELVPGERGPVDADLLSREVGLVAPPEARAAWADHHLATFAYGDGAGRVRVTLSRDHRGPTAALRLLHGDAPPLDRLGLPPEVGGWLAGRGLVAIAGPAGAGKTTTLAALVRALGERRKTVIAIEDPIEIVQTGPSISQRALGEHVHSFTEGAAAALREGADVLAVGAVATADAAAAVVEAVAGGLLVLTTVISPLGRLAVDQIVHRLPADQREHARLLLGEALVGTITPVSGRGGGRTFEIAGR